MLYQKQLVKSAQLLRLQVYFLPYSPSCVQLSACFCASLDLLFRLEDEGVIFFRNIDHSPNTWSQNPEHSTLYDYNREDLNPKEHYCIFKILIISSLVQHQMLFNERPIVILRTE
jgi:hypothetical protein